MTVSIKPIDPVNRAFFAGEVSGLDLRKPLTKDEVAAVHAKAWDALVKADRTICDEAISEARAALLIDSTLALNALALGQFLHHMVITDTGADTKIAFDATNGATLVGLGDPNLLHASDFIFA